MYFLKDWQNYYRDIKKKYKGTHLEAQKEAYIDKKADSSKKSFRKSSNELS